MFLLSLLLAARHGLGNITATMPGASLPLALAEIGRQTGLRLEARGEMLAEVLSLRLKDADAEEALAKIAEVVGGEWRSVGDTRVLVASPQAERKEIALQREAQRANIEIALNDELAEVKKTSRFSERTAAELARQFDKAFRTGGEESAEVFKVQRGTPAHRLLIRLLAAIPVDDLTGWSDGSRVVFSDRPTRMQRPLPSGAAEAIRAFAREQSLWQVAASSALPDDAGARDPRRVPVPPEGFKVDLVVEDWEDSQGFSASLNVLGPNGRSVSQSMVRLDGADDKAYRESLRPIDPLPGEAPIQGATEAAELQGLVMITRKSERTPESERQPLLAKWRDRMESPLKFEPLAYVPGDLWVRVAEARGQNLVANAYEEAFSTYGDDRDGPADSVTPSTVLRELAKNERVEAEGRWITIRPRHLLMARRDRIDRSAAGNLLRKSLSAGTIRIDDVAEYMASYNRHNGLLAWDGGYLRAFFRGTGPQSMLRTIAARDEMRFYGLLTPSQRSTLRQRPIPLGDLSSEAKAHLERMVYWNGWLTDDVDGEPTELFPDGIPANGTLSLAKDEYEDLVLPFTKGQPLIAQNFSPRTAARLGSMLANPSGPQNPAAWNRFRLLTGHTLRLRLDYAPGASHEVLLYEVIDPRQPAVGYDQLPPAFRAEVERARAETIAKAKATPVPQGVPPPR